MLSQTLSPLPGKGIIIVAINTEYFEKPDLMLSIVPRVFVYP